MWMRFPLGLPKKVQMPVYGEEDITHTKVSFVDSPCYRSARTIEDVVDEIRETMEQIPKYVYDIVLVK